jgi:hypothetical protein
MGTESWESCSNSSSLRRAGSPRAAREREFHLAVTASIHRAVGECEYEPETYAQMVRLHGSVQAVGLLLGEPLSDDSLQLWARGRCDLTIEALAQREEWKDLFTHEVRSVAARRYAGWLSAPAPGDVVAKVLASIGNPVVREPEDDIAWGE